MAALSNILRARSYVIFVFLAASSFLIGLPKDSRAFPVTINTAALNGTAARFDFVLFDGDLTANNSVTISSFLTNGTLQGTDCSVSCSGGPPFTITDTGGFGELTQDLILGTDLSFNLTATHNFAGSDADVLVLNLLNPATNFTLVDTNLDALNAPVPFLDALLVLGIRVEPVSRPQEERAQ